ncbi:MAG: fibronectin type III domain-containing protein, partial [Candidatus Marinimicrobia bacterium]|nr:fibronectin type III domain-containing protein [Candidatus Neomarinimicrobiota bacterium]
FLTATSSDPSGIALSWTDGSAETGFRIERRLATDTGTFAPLQDVAADTTAFLDTTALRSIVYEYRVRAPGLPGDSSWSVPATAYIENTYQLWLQSNGLPIDESGEGAPDAQPAHDGIDNLTKYGLGLNPLVSGYSGRISFGLMKISGISYLTFTYSRPYPAPGGITYTVKASGDLKGWSSSGLVETANTINDGLRTITIRDAVSGKSRFMRLEVSRP